MTRVNKTGVGIHTGFGFELKYPIYASASLVTLTITAATL
jgi:hypothetical protein